MFKISFCCILCQLFLAGILSAEQATPRAHLEISRKSKMLSYFDSNGTLLWQENVGIGKGGIGEKKNMQDYITPTGDFTVDIILYRQPEYNTIDEQLLKRYVDSHAENNFFQQEQALKQLFDNMSALDFDQNGSPDRAYGSGYIGLTSNTAVTGPKLSKLNGKTYWFSIALHGTNKPEENLGQARSGGCVHLSEIALNKLITEGQIQIGTAVKIRD